ncbi:hypothetical protein J3R82DRAFT_6877 [Butyriboletus roseoflavus]|nr:hypothetical protein J3R82DRAFT_6877 [Butyriboletus roseoflavus]
MSCILRTLPRPSLEQTPPSAAEWDIIHRYSHRIRELSIGPIGQFSLSFLRSTSSHPSLLVPNLRVLKWRSGINPFLSIKFIQRFLSPSLISLDVALSDADDERMQSFFASYPSLCPDLKSIVINVARPKQVSTTTIGTLSRAIPRYKHLESLDLSVPINDVALTHIILSPTFIRLALALHPDISSLHQICIPSDITPFRNVEKLSLEVWDLDFVTTLLRTQDQMFRSFVLRHRSTPTTDAAFTFFSALASRQRTRSLRSIRLTPVMPDRVDVDGLRSAPRESDEPVTHYHLTYDTLRPLTSLSHLRELVIDLGRWFSIDDDDLLSLTRNWASLQVLHLNRRQYVEEHPWRLVKYLTFKGLSALLECCPDLRDFCLPLDAREVLVNMGKTIGNIAVTYIHSPNTPTVILVCWKKF